MSQDLKAQWEPKIAAELGKAKQLQVALETSKYYSQ